MPSTSLSNLPVMTADITSLGIGGFHGCGIKNGDVYCWGNNSGGELGDGTTTNRSTAVLISGP